MKRLFQNSNIYLFFAFIIMAILFYSSSQTYEQQSQLPFLEKYLSSQPFQTQLNGISFVYAGEQMSIQAQGYFKFVEFFIRKGAHLLTYFLLGGSWFLGLRPRINQLGLTGVVAWLSATGYAGLDEIHQMATGGRTPLFQDIALDSIGALLAVLICWLLAGLRRGRGKG